MAACALWTLCLLSSIAAAQPASNADLERAEAKAIEAKVFFKGGLYAEAATGFMQAFAISRRPDMMFNAARAYEQAGMAAQAVALFEQYQQLTDAPAQGKKDAALRIAQLNAVLQARRAATAAPETGVSPTTPRPAQPPAADPVQAPVQVPVQVPVQAALPQPTHTRVDPAAPRPSKAWSITLAAGGGTLVLVGLLSWSAAVNQIDTANKMDFAAVNAQTSYTTSVQQAKSTRAFGIGSSLVGIGLGVWGGWRLWHAPAHESKAKASAVLTPVLDIERGLGGLALGGSF